MTFTKIEIKEIRDKLRVLEQKEADDVKVISDAKRKIASDWWNTIKPTIPATREEALTAYRLIEELLKTETDAGRSSILRQKLNLANEKFKEMKRIG